MTPIPALTRGAADGMSLASRYAVQCPLSGLADGVDLIWGYAEGYTLRPVIIEKGYIGVNRGFTSYGDAGPHRCWTMPTPVCRGQSVLGRDAPDLMANAILV